MHLTDSFIQSDYPTVYLIYNARFISQLEVLFFACTQSKIWFYLYRIVRQHIFFRFRNLKSSKRSDASSFLSSIMQNKSGWTTMPVIVALHPAARL